MDTEPTSASSGAVGGFLDAVEEKMNEGTGTRHVAQLLPEEHPREPDPPDVWKDEDALGEWMEELPRRDEVIVLRVVNTPPEDQQFKNQTRPPSQ
ncbi:hypothetical protein [Salinibacter sp.]|uniref:hypothetical protein n=1 Tax=Salinibacter sp. TaxID=2065818 RepID=UPI0021E8C2AC|nr:hypothetical protein [Salinibacter sp.]